MKPHTYRVHFGGSFVDFLQRQAANGFCLIKRATGYPAAYVQPIGY